MFVILFLNWKMVISFILPARWCLSGFVACKKSYNSNMITFLGAKLLYEPICLYYKIHIIWLIICKILNDYEFSLNVVFLNKRIVIFCHIACFLLLFPRCPYFLVWLYLCLFISILDCQLLNSSIVSLSLLMKCPITWSQDRLQRG